MEEHDGLREAGVEGHVATLGGGLTRKSITTNPAVVTCDVCGRTLLRGEHADVFIAGGQRRSVCELCTGRAVHEGWIREGLDDVVARSRDGRHRKGGSLLSRLRSRRSEPAHHEPPAPRDPFSPDVYADDGYGDEDYVLPPEPVEAHAPAPAPVAAPGPAPVAAHGPAEPVDHTLYEQRSVRGVPTNAELKVARA